jgi:hypothetical protein
VEDLLSDEMIARQRKLNVHLAFLCHPINDSGLPKLMVAKTNITYAISLIFALQMLFDLFWKYQQKPRLLLIHSWNNGQFSICCFALLLHPCL